MVQYIFLILIPLIEFATNLFLSGCGILTHDAPLNYGHLKLSSTFLKAMPNYRRPYTPGGIYFITQVTYRRQPWLCIELGRAALRHVQEQHPFEIQDFVLLPDHFHALWTLPEGDQNLS